MSFIGEKTTISGIQKVKNRYFWLSTGNVWAVQESEIVIVFYAFCSSHKAILTLLSREVTVIAVFRMSSGLPVTSGSRHNSKPSHDTVQLVSYHLRKKLGRYLTSFAPNFCSKLFPLKKTPSKRTSRICNSMLF